MELKRIRDVRFENFRCFKELEINGLGDINIIVGKNNTGKSTFLEGLILGLYNETFFLNERVESSFYSFNLINFLFERRNLHLPKYPLRPNFKNQIVIIKNPEEEEYLLDSIQKFFKYKEILNTKIILNREYTVNIVEKQEILSHEKLFEDIFPSFI
ncbi:ATP-binding protein [Aquifex sp.]